MFFGRQNLLHLADPGKEDEVFRKVYRVELKHKLRKIVLVTLNIAW